MNRFVNRAILMESVVFLQCVNLSQAKTHTTETTDEPSFQRRWLCAHSRCCPWAQRLPLNTAPGVRMIIYRRGRRPM
jgi:hypothetical protein